MFGTLFARLAGALVALSFVLSLALVLILQSSHQSFHLELEQRQHQHLAERLASRIRAGDQASLEAVFEQVRQFAVLNSALVAYTVDEDGTVTASSHRVADLRRRRVSVAPILDFIQGPADWPLLGDDPASERGKAPFSAARIAPGSGYLYVVLSSDAKAQGAMPAGNRSNTLREALWLAVANVVAALIATLVVVGFITRPVRRLRRAMETFDASKFAGSARYGAVPGRAARDEIDRLGEIFDSMADRIAAQIDSLRRSDEARRELYANISHDLETPLTSLHGYVETLLMKDGALPAAQRRRYLEILNRQTQQLRELIDQITDLARLETPEIRLQMHEVKVEPLLQHILEDLKPLIEKKGLKIELNASAPGIALPGDARLLRRALANIVVNAIQASPEGSAIAIRVTGGVAGTVEISVGDRGPGLRPEEMERVFEAHYRGSHRARPGSAGMGLGLAIVRKVVELHGGSIVAGNANGGGAEFRVTLPSSRPQA